MANVTFAIERTWTDSFDDKRAIRLLHEERARLLHSLADAVDVDIVDWGDTDGDYPREVVEIIAVLGSAGVFTALVQVFRSWIERKKMLDVQIVLPDGSKVSVARGTPDDIERVIRSLRLPKESRAR